MVGAGGAARGVVGPLLGTAPERIVVANRTHTRAVDLVERLEDPRLAAVPLDRLAGDFDVVINATSAALLGGQPLVPAAAVVGAFCYDMVYGDHGAGFREWAVANGARGVSDGVGMLVEQAAEAFWLWRGVRPETARVIADLRAGSS